MQTYVNTFFHFVNNTYLFGLPIDHLVHIAVCFTLFLIFRRGFRFSNAWAFALIFFIGLGKVWYSWGAMIHNGRYENPVEKMFDNGLGAALGYFFYARFLHRTKSRNRRRT